MAKKLTWRLWLLIFALVLSLLAIQPWLAFEKGVIIKSVEQNSTASESGLFAGEIITSINRQKVETLEEYSNLIHSLFTENQTEKIRVDIGTKNSDYVLFTNQPPEIAVKDLPENNIKTGLDLQGGARALIAPDLEPGQEFTDADLQDLKQVTQERFNVYGLQDVEVNDVRDLSGNKFLLIEIAGATPKDLEELIAKQGKFEAKIGNETAFVGGKKDITYVARSGDQTGIYSCDDTQDGSYCNFRFTVSLSEEAAQRHADITANLTVEMSEGGQRYLSEKLDLYVDDVLVDSLFISEDLKGKVTTQVSIQGSGSGPDRQSAIKDAEDSMKKLQTILITGSLPYKLKIEKLDTISPVLGQQFTNIIILTGIGALAAVGIFIFIRYRRLKTSLALLFTSFSEIFIILGIASFINWNLDLPSIAGILTTIGTGIDQQIVILDESRKSRYLSMKERLKRALFIIVGAYFTCLVAMLPLFYAGAGLFKGFALTTIIGITVGVLITRPAFADIVKKIEE